MVFPLSDDNSDRQRVPWITWSLITANVLVFVLFQQGGTNDSVTLAFFQVPAEIMSGQDIVTEPSIREVEYEGQQYQISVPGLRPTPIPVYLTLLTGIFLHGGWMHLLGNMTYLYIFGDNIEEKLGKIKFLIFYFLTGLCAALTQALLDTSSTIPMIGASGAIAGILGGYLVLYPKANIKVFFWFIIFFKVFRIRAFIVLGGWILIQFLSFSGEEFNSGGVAYGAHIGGFIAGAILIKLFCSQKLIPNKPNKGSVPNAK